MLYRFSEHTYPDPEDRDKWLEPPIGKHLEIMKCAMEPHQGIRKIDLCCGLGFGKTLLLIQLAAVKMDRVPGTKILFLEPDWDRVDSVFIEKWIEHVPPSMYDLNIGRHLITWRKNGNTLRARPRILTGSKDRAKDKRRGPEYTDVFCDETAIGFDYETYTNTLARVRAPGTCKTYITATTPKIGPYGDFLSRGGNIVFHARTRDNQYLMKREPTYEADLRADMLPDQARRELDGELISLEGRIWKQWSNDQWPNGNIHKHEHEYERPYMLTFDPGVASSAWLGIQQVPPYDEHGRLLWDYDPVWVVTFELQPKNDGSIDSMTAEIDLKYGRPASVVVGHDINKRSDGSGKKGSFFVVKRWGSVPVIPVSGLIGMDKDVQHNQLSYGIFDTGKRRRFCVSKNLISHYPDTRRGIIEVMQQDTWAEKGPHKMPKDGRLEHTRDAAMYAAVMKMFPPKYGLYKRNAA
jgi:hypothetical protein